MTWKLRKSFIPFVIIGLLVVCIIIGFNIYVGYIRKQNLVGPVGIFMQKRAEQRYKNGQAFRIYLKREVTNVQANAFLQDIQNKPNIIGTSIVTKAGRATLLEHERNINKLTKEELDNLQTSIDIFVKEPGMKEGIAQSFSTNGLVDRIDYLK